MTGGVLATDTYAASSRLDACSEHEKKEGSRDCVTPQTKFGWLSDSEFEVQVNQEKYTLLDSTRDKLGNLGLHAVDALEDLLKQSDSPGARLKAVELVLKTQGILDPQSGLYGAGIGPTGSTGVPLAPTVAEDYWKETAEFQ